MICVTHCPYLLKNETSLLHGIITFIACCLYSDQSQEQCPSNGQKEFQPVCFTDEKTKTIFSKMNGKKIAENFSHNRGTT